MHRGFKFRLEPTPQQAEILGQWVGVTRLVYNLALEQRRDFWRQYQAVEGRSISFASQCRELTALRAQADWIAAVPHTALEAALRDLDRSYSMFFKGGGYPTLRRLGVNDSVRFRGQSMAFRDLNSKWAEVKVPKMGWVRFRKSRSIKGEILTVTIGRQAGKWTVVFANDVGAAPSINALPAVGIDRGVTQTLSLSNGEHVRLPDMTMLERRKKRAQRILARKRRGSRRYGVQRRAVARIASRIARVRSHHLHLASTDIARRFGTVALEALKIGDMTASAKGTVDKPGRNVRQKAGLNRSILAQGWGIFAAMLDYKLEAAGGRLVYVPAAFTSQTCAECGVVDAQSRKSQAVFECVHCGHVAHADTNAALEIKRRSTAFVEGGHLGRPVEARTSAPCALEPA